MLKLTFPALVILLLTSCNGNNHTVSQTENKSDLNESLINANKALIEAEREEIESYIRRHSLNMQETESGLRYKINCTSEGSLIQPGNVVELKYSIFLLNGDYCYSSDSTGNIQFRVEKSEAVNGFHEAVQLMHINDKAMLLLPSHLAFGLTGDQDKIPMASALVCNIEVVNVSR